VTLSEYAAFDALGLAELVATKQVSPKELAKTAAQAIAATNPSVNAVVETYPDRIDGLDETDSKRKCLGTAVRHLFTRLSISQRHSGLFDPAVSSIETGGRAGLNCTSALD
jgi:hypothetical protein